MMLSKPCPQCGKAMIRRHTLGAPYAGGCPYFWWCRCLYTEQGGMDTPALAEAFYLEVWELVNADALAADALAAAARASQELLGAEMAAEYPVAEEPAPDTGEQSAENGEQSAVSSEQAGASYCPMC